MNKHLIAAAVAAAVAAPAMAQNVEIYGVLDIGYHDAKASGKDKPESDRASQKRNRFGGETGLAGNRLGFRGTEDLGAGLKANFVLETNVATDGGFGTHRLANIGLSSGAGTLTIGRQVTFGKGVMDSFTAFGGGGSFTTGSTVHTASGMNGAAEIAGSEFAKTTKNIGAFSGRSSNALTYVSPKFSGFDFGLQLIRNNLDGSELEGKTGSNATAFRLAYAAGPLSAAFVRTDGKVETEQVAGKAGICIDGATGALVTTTFAATATKCATTTANRVSGTFAAAEKENEVSNNQFGARYTMGNVNLFLAYASNTDELDGAIGDLSTKGTDVGVTVGLGATTLLASIGSGRINLGKGKGEVEVDGYQLQAHQALSKRTTLYALYGSNKFDENQQAGGGDFKDAVTMFGMRHTF